MGKLFVICAVAGMLAVPAGALAQSSASTQYTPNVGTAGSTATGGNGSSGNAGGIAGTGAANGTAGQAQAGGGSLPFTGYPLTPLIAIILALLAAGLATRLVVMRLDQRRA